MNSKSFVVHPTNDYAVSTYPPQSAVLVKKQLILQVFPKPLLASNRHLLHQKRTTLNSAARVHIITDSNDGFEHLIEITSNGDLLDRVLRFPVLDPKTRSAARIIAGDQINACLLYTSPSPRD